MSTTPKKYPEFAPGELVRGKHKEAKYHGRTGVVVAKVGKKGYTVLVEQRQRAVYLPSGGGKVLTSRIDIAQQVVYSCYALTRVLNESE